MSAKTRSTTWVASSAKSKSVRFSRTTIRTGSSSAKVEDLLLLVEDDPTLRGQGERAPRTVEELMAE